MIADKICKIYNCEKKVKANGLCSRHCEQVRLYGKVLSRTKNDPNEIEIKEDFALIHLYDFNCNVIAKAIIDLEDIDKVKQYKWSLSDYGYARTVNNIKLHHVILETTEMHDHKNTIKLDNRKENLRPCNISENQQNKNIAANNTSGAKGVSWHKRFKKYSAYISINKKQIFLGYFVDLIEATKAYNKAAIELFGEFALLNDIEKLKERRVS